MIWCDIVCNRTSNSEGEDDDDSDDSDVEPDSNSDSDTEPTIKRRRMVGWFVSSLPVFPLAPSPLIPNTFHKHH